MRVKRSLKALAWFALTPAVAVAQPPDLRVGLDYRTVGAPVDCPSESELRAAISRQVGYDPFVPTAERRNYDLRVEILRAEAATEAHITWLDAQGAVEGERQLSSEDEQCSELANGVVFAVAVQLQLRAATVREQAQPPPAPVVKPKPPPKRAAPRAQRAVLVGLGGFGRRGTQPGVSAGVRSFGALRSADWALSLEAAGTLPTTQRSAEGSGFSARELGLALAPCLRRGVVDACGLGTASLFSVRGEGVDRVRTPSTVLFGAGLRLQLAWPELERLALLARVDVVALLTPRDVIVNRERVWSTAPLAVTLGLDAAAIFR
jgi:hypothetical protein